jgi:hypothetical protein
MSEYELKDHPKLSYGNHIDDDEMVVIKVDEGVYEGTVFNYREVNMDGDDDQLKYGIDFHAFFVNGVSRETEPSIRELTEFYETVTSPFLYNMVLNSANANKE